MRRITTPEELSKEYSQIPEEWIQFLTENCSNPKVWILADEDDFAVLLDSISPPLCDYFTAILMPSIETIRKVRAIIKAPLVIVMPINEQIPDGGKVSSVNVRFG